MPCSVPVILQIPVNTDLTRPNQAAYLDLAPSVILIEFLFPGPDDKVRDRTWAHSRGIHLDNDSLDEVTELAKLWAAQVLEFHNVS